MEEKIKYIRGVIDRGGDVNKRLQKENIKGYNRYSVRAYSDPTNLFYVDNGYIKHIDVDTVLGRFLIELGEEMFLEPKYKFKVGDKVTTREPIFPNEDYYNVVEQVNRNGEPWYRLEYKNSKGLLHEDNLLLYERRGVTWSDLAEIPMKGYYINGVDSRICEFNGLYCDEQRNVAKSEEVAKSMLAMAQISQLMAFYGGRVTDEEWENERVYKYSIRRRKGKVEIVYSIHAYSFLSFHKQEQAKDFFNNNRQLVLDYLML